VARKVLDEDDDFRQRVASQLSESDVGEAGWLWLTRPDGWERRVEQLRQKQAEAEHQGREDRAERHAQRRLSFAEDRARRAEAQVQLRTSEADEARAALVQARAEALQLGADLERLSGQLTELREQRNQAVRQLKEVEGELARRSSELRQARHEIRMREAELAEAPATIVTAAQPDAPRPLPTGDLDRERLAVAVRRAATAAEELSGALAAASSILVPEAASGASSPSPQPRSPSARGRRPVALPPGVLDDSVAAAEHLLRAPGVLLLVDGYNVSKEAWPSLSIAVQRSRLVDALAELHARCGAEIEVVFDGAETELPAVAAARAAVRVRFSPGGVEADDVLLDLVDRVPVERPVLVASSDKRVRDGARQRGANALGARQLLAALGR
jgi:predicted RNA-binding protein with PIN domain